nr:hypothetical protein CFP56_58149 [Quercus suber]
MYCCLCEEAGTSLLHALASRCRKRRVQCHGSWTAGSTDIHRHVHEGTITIEATTNWTMSCGAESVKQYDELHNSEMLSSYASSKLPELSWIGQRRYKERKAKGHNP